VTAERAAEQAEKLKKAARKNPIILSAHAQIAVDKALRRLAQILQGQMEPTDESGNSATDGGSGWSPIS
jgi:C4-dicarboxylate-specific signal transduction histidine kinase